MLLIRVLPIFYLISSLLSFALAEFGFEAVYEIKHYDETHALNLAKIEGGETSMKFIFVKTDEGTLHGIHEVESYAETAESGSTTQVNPNAAAETLDTDTTPKQYNAVLDTTSWLSVFNVDFPSNGFLRAYSKARSRCNWTIQAKANLTLVSL